MLPLRLASYFTEAISRTSVSLWLMAILGAITSSNSSTLSSTAMKTSLSFGSLIRFAYRLLNVIWCLSLRALSGAHLSILNFEGVVGAEKCSFRQNFLLNRCFRELNLALVRSVNQEITRSDVEKKGHKMRQEERKKRRRQ
jgi:hypothetical protein